MRWIVLACLALLGCEMQPKPVEKIQVDPVLYTDHDCKELARERAKIDIELQQAEISRKERRRRDALGLLVLGVPVGSMQRETSRADLATQRGKLDAIDIVQREKGCT